MKKVADLPQACMHPEHSPPGHVVLSDGIYEHTCPGCGFTSTVIVANARFSSPAKTTTLNATADAVVEELWVDETPAPLGPVLWLRAKDADLVGVPRAHWGALKKAVKRLH